MTVTSTKQQTTTKIKNSHYSYYARCTSKHLLQPLNQAQLYLCLFNWERKMLLKYLPKKRTTSKI